MVSNSEIIVSGPQRQRIPKELVVLGTAAATLAGIGFMHGFSGLETVVGNVMHGHGIFSSFGTYHTIPGHSAYYGSISQLLTTPNKDGMYVSTITNPIGSDSAFLSINNNPLGPGYLVNIVYHMPATLSHTAFTPFSFEQNAEILADVSLGASGIIGGAKLLDRR